MKNVNKETQSILHNIRPYNDVWLKELKGMKYQNRIGTLKDINGIEFTLLESNETYTFDMIDWYKSKCLWEGVMPNIEKSHQE